MLRFRRYRVLLIFAAVVTLVLIRFTHIRDWESYTSGGVLDIHALKDEKTGAVAPQAPLPPKAAVPNTPGSVKEQPKEELKPAKAPAALSTSFTSSKALLTSTFPTVPTADAITPKIILPDRKRPSFGYDDEDQDFDDIHAIAPDGRQELPIFSAAPTTIHWSKQTEHFPVPTESVPKSMPKIQYSFKDETTDAKIDREKRQNQVKAEFLKSWQGYRKFAWGHDELSPVSGKFRDPFCGWAATLVDGLDTLWIMDLHDEFEDAVKAVALIDFTTTPRPEIPVFETTIRYLGGLLAAYDVSGAKYPVLLEKAVELAEILMGAFDTPNRMPILYYSWKPTFASQPHRASTSSNLAELGSLSMEFTRLAQLTKEPRYYDAVARVTNALSDWQDRNTTKLPGVFPEYVDASGCNRTATNLKQQAAKEAAMAKESLLSAPETAALLKEDPQGYKPPMPETVAEPKPKKKATSEEKTLEMQVLPGEPHKAHIKGWDEDSKLARRALEDTTGSSTSKTGSSSPPPAAQPAEHPASNPQVHPISQQKIKSDLQTLSDWDCVKQGLDSPSRYGQDKFSMAGGQDSTYEYFPKQHLLLGGLEPVYEKLYRRTAHAIRENMLYRPMVPGNDDILVSGSVSTAGNPGDHVLHPEIQHLTCFIGGMVGMSAKLFGLDGDLELAKKLTDGCVWAYGATASGIMPEGAVLVACESAEHCSWNKTLYYEYLDPSAAYHDKNLADYIANKAKLAAEEKAKLAAAEEEGYDQIASQKADAVGEPQGHVASTGTGSTGTTSKEGTLKPAEAPQVANSGSGSSGVSSTGGASSNVGSSGSGSSNVNSPASDSSKGAVKDQDAFKPKEKPASLTKRQTVPGESKEALNGKTMGNSGKTGTPVGMTDEKENMFKEKSTNTEVELQNMASGRQLEKGAQSQKALPEEVLPDPLRPLSHNEYVEARIKQESLPPGFVTIGYKKYILRPEAIESVWYMYRITGDKTWQDKGWKMFEAVINATSTKYGHSAIYDVTAEEPTQIDEMESFWLAETLKYFYLLFSTPDTISLDDWVLNTEAHPFKRPS
ncbi:glycosyl hydrolase family 47 protein [Rutstroemia sp. NJR-2017a BBW]|nr:glycosyl hydrolase family 47 protein [Rutstroemia sp. NJR-2017a BBW]